MEVPIVSNFFYGQLYLTLFKLTLIKKSPLN
jgi:hypothetical protein